MGGVFPSLPTKGKRYQ